MDVTQTKCAACNKKLSVPIISKSGILCDTCKNQGLFRKKLIITGITRMNKGNICVSGIDPETWRFVRPVYPSGLERDFIMEGTTQIVRLFNVVEMELKGFIPNDIYHTEDWLINENFAPKFVCHITDEVIIKLLRCMAVNDLNAAIAKQDKSLFIVNAQRICKMWHEHSYGKFKVRVDFIDGVGNFFSGIPVTDLLTLAKARWIVETNRNADYADEIINMFNNNPYHYIRIGLTRQFLGQYWKQVTAIITIPDLFNGESFADYEKKLGGHA